MAQSMRRPEILGAMDREPKRDKTRTGYFGNVKNRLGSKLPPGISQPPQFAKPPWETQPQSRGMQESAARSQHQHHPVLGRPLNHIPHIRNPKLRQYYLQGTSWDNAGLSGDATGSTGLPGDTVFSVSSQFNGTSAASAERSHHASSNVPSPSTFLTPREGKNASSGRGSSRTELNSESDPKEKTQAEADQDSLDTLSVPPHSPSPEAEYDKLLDVEAVPLPDGQLCLLALPPECCEGEGAEAMRCLKLFCRFITDRKGVVSGILLVTPNKIFFDPSKTHVLVKEHGCEEYLLSYSIDNLASVAFFSDISHVHFSASQQRKGKKMLQKMFKKRAGKLPNLKESSVPPQVSAVSSDLSNVSLNKGASEQEEAESGDLAEAELDNSPLEVLSEACVAGLGAAVLNSAATFCFGGQEAENKVKMELLQTDRTEASDVNSHTTAAQKLTAGASGSLMFVRLRVQPSAGEKRSVGGLHLGLLKTAPQREAWLALSQESSDKLYAYLTHCRPDLCIIEGADEEEGDHDEEEFILIDDEKEENEDDVFQRRRSAGDDWEMVLMDEGREKPPVPDRDPDGLNKVVENSHILEASHVKELHRELPPRTVGHTWQLAYSTSRHGASLKSLYRKMATTESPVLIVIKDALDEIFGAFLSHPLRPSETFYGTGETFLFMLHPRFKCFRWTGDNSFFIKGDLDSFAIGGGSGHFGLWLDENLYLGRSSPCLTFNNCCLSETDDFRVMDLEVWTFC
ncbi:nuclear receptor coactivator 7 isoform X3 [Betta splendens]|uniref:Nuclear receptor coactivator 7 isoform X3 n=1 Tax=Betta splendens TaxID=158456 RepID=A0A9W2XJC9_BETSP|nr:nuclear receptor coactivator 7 isoform X3 [Betta splendens]